MAVKYCDKCGLECIQTFRLCSRCGNNSFSDKPVDIVVAITRQQNSTAASHEKVEKPAATIAQKGAQKDKSQKTSNKLEGIGGWLTFFVVGLVFFSPVIVGFQVIELISLLQPLPESNIKNWLTFIACYQSLITLFGVFVGIRIWKKNIYAINHAKIYLKVSVLCAIILVSCNVYYFDSYAAIGPTITGSLVSVAWYLYLTKSKRVKNVFS